MIKKGVRENDPNSGMYAAPGGKLKDGENSVDSVIREFREETGLELIEPKLIGIALFDNSNRTLVSFKETPDFLVYVFISNKFRGKIKTETKGESTEWIDNKKITSLNPRKCDKKLWNLVKNKKKFFTVFKFNEENLDDKNCKIFLI